MTANDTFEILLVTAPGLESALAEEAREAGFAVMGQIAGGVLVNGGWRDVWRANLVLRGAARVLVRIGEFHAVHLAQLDKRSRSFPWADFLRADTPVHVEATCRKSRIYHSKAAAQRITTAISEELGAPINDDAEIIIKARIENDLVTLSIDTSGELLHKRGSKQAMAKAPMRENMAALFLRLCGYDGMEPVLDPMCGSGTFVIEAAEWAAGLAPGRNRSFAFEKLATFDERAWRTMKQKPSPGPSDHPLPSLRDGRGQVEPSPALEWGRVREAGERANFFGSDRDAGAIAASQANASRADVAHLTHFEKKTVSEITPPPGSPGLVICNPPYGSRIGEEKKLVALYSALGASLRERFHGWRVGMITSNERLARATGLPFGKPSAPILHGGLRIRLFQTKTLA
jgi:putative N6-adenine-specific DNA methylase